MTRARITLDVVAQRSPDVVAVVSADGLILCHNASVERVLGVAPDGLVGTELAALSHPRDRARVDEWLARATVSTGEPESVEWRARHADGSWRWLESAAASMLDEPEAGDTVVSSRDVTRRILRADQLRRDSLHDPLTGLANRALFRDRLDHALRAARRGDRTVGLLLLDLDDFSMVDNGPLHDTGDRILVQVAARLQGCVRKSDTVARLDSDLFAVVLTYGDSEIDAAALAGRLLTAVAQPFRIDDREVTLSASIGITTTKAGADARDLLRDADMAMRGAKHSGKGRCTVYQPEHRGAVISDLRLAADLRDAFANGDLSVDYQPILDLRTQELVGAEALLRWEHPTRGWVPPAVFIPVAEANGLIVPIGSWLLRHTMDTIGSWRVHGRRPLTLSVNLSVRQLEDDGLVDDVRDALSSTGFDPALLTLEVTESMLVDRAEEAIRRLHALKGLGVRLSIDDFGTGYSSLSYLKRLPVDELKIDREFVAHLTESPQDHDLVRTILGLSRDFGLETVAEGIESREQLELLRTMGCERIQGYYVSPPLHSAEARRRLAPQRRPLALAGNIALPRRPRQRDPEPTIFAARNAR